MRGRSGKKRKKRNDKEWKGLMKWVRIVKESCWLKVEKMGKVKNKKRLRKEKKKGKVYKGLWRKVGGLGSGMKECQIWVVWGEF